jgi:hypothetical protein
MKVKSSKKLFDHWTEFGVMGFPLRGIVQNDLDIEDEEFKTWLRAAYRCQERLDDLIAATALHLTGKRMPR